MTHPPQQELSLRMAELARAIAAPRGTAEVLDEVTAAATELIPGVDIAGVLLLGPNKTFESLATTAELVHQLDVLQMRFQEGPCVEAALSETIVRTDDFTTETRWPQYSAAAVEHGVRAALSFKLYTADRTAGALNLFSFRPTQWDTESETVGTVLAAHAAAAILASRQSEQLQSALATRDRIGQAKGIIMERHRVDDVRAFAMLRQLSQEQNVRLVDVAQRVIETRGG